VSRDRSIDVGTLLFGHPVYERVEPDQAVPGVAAGQEEVAFQSAASLRDSILAEVGKAVVGHEDVIELMTLAAIAGGHVLVEGPPGVAKTLVSNAFAHALGLTYTRVQFTPDTMPSDITGVTTDRMGEPVFVPGPVFTNVLLVDEINRTPPRTQAALLEAMQERRVTVDGATHWLPSPFIVVATQNPYEQHGVHALPESQLDRFLFKLDMNPGDEAHELQMLMLPHVGVAPDLIGDIRPLMGPTQLMLAQREVDSTHVPEDVARYLIGVVRNTREDVDVALGASPRAAIHLLAAAKASARLQGRDEVVNEDVARMAYPVLSHRIVMRKGGAARAIEAALTAGR